MKKHAFMWSAPSQAILGNSLENIQKLLTVLRLKKKINPVINLLSTENIVVYFFF